MGVSCPTLAILRNCWDSNPDGAGFAFNDGNRVIIKKGFMSWDAFKSAWVSCSKRYDFKNRGVLIHFRITTHGGTNPQNTHPFPVVSDTGMMQKPECVCEYAAIHNGIISATSAQATRERTTSDTLVFIRDYLSLIAQNKAWFKRRANLELISLLIDAPHSKMAILNGRGEIIHTDGFVEDNGILYSNTSYKIPRIRNTTKYNYPSYYNSYDDDDDFDYYGNGYRYGSYYGYGGCYNNTNHNYNNPKKADFKAIPASTGKDIPFDTDNRVPLMRCAVNDVVRCESYDDTQILNSDEAIWCVSKEGYMYQMIEDSPRGVCSDDSDYALDFCGSGCIMDAFQRPKKFVANFWADKGQFLGGTDPDEVNSWGTFGNDDYSYMDDDMSKKDNQEKR